MSKKKEKLIREIDEHLSRIIPKEKWLAKMQTSAWATHPDKFKTPEFYDSIINEFEEIKTYNFSEVTVPNA